MLERLLSPFAAGGRPYLLPEMRHLARVAGPSPLGQDFDKLLERLAVQLDIGSRFVRPLPGLVLDLRGGAARRDVGTVEENANKFERVRLIYLWPITKREPHGPHDGTLASARAVRATRSRQLELRKPGAVLV